MKCQIFFITFMYSSLPSKTQVYHCCHLLYSSVDYFGSVSERNFTIFCLATDKWSNHFDDARFGQFCEAFFTLYPTHLMFTKNSLQQYVHFSAFLTYHSTCYKDLHCGRMYCYYCSSQSAMHRCFKLQF